MPAPVLLAFSKPLASLAYWSLQKSQRQWADSSFKILGKTWSGWRPDRTCNNNRPSPDRKIQRDRRNPKKRKAARNPTQAQARTKGWKTCRRGRDKKKGETPHLQWSASPKPSTHKNMHDLSSKLTAVTIELNVPLWLVDTYLSPQFSWQNMSNFCMANCATARLPARQGHQAFVAESQLQHQIPCGKNGGDFLGKSKEIVDSMLILC